MVGLQSLMPELRGMDLQQLGSMLVSGQKDVPANLIIAAMTEQQQAAETADAVKRQMAMVQNAQQPKGTIAQQVVQRAMQGAAQGYAGGGAVAFRNGGALKFQTAGAVPPGLLNPDFDEEGLPRGKTERENIIDYNNKVRAAYDRQMRAKAAQSPRTAAPSMQQIAETMTGRSQQEEFYKPRNPEAYTPEALAYRVSGAQPTDTSKLFASGPPESPMMPVPEIQIAPSRAASGAGPTGVQQRQPGSAPAASADTGLPVDTPIDMSAYRQRLENLASEMRTGSQPSEAVLFGRQGLAALAAQNIAEQRKEAKDAETAAKAELERRLQYTRSSPFSDAQSLFRIAAAIDPRRGKGMGSLSGAISGEMEKRTAAGEEAQKAFATSQEGARQRNALIRQAQFLEATRAHAEAVGDDATERQARQQLATLYTELEKFNVDVQQKSKDQALARYNAQSQRMGAQAQMKSAGKPTAQETLRSWFESDPKGFSAFIEAQNEPKSAAAIRKSLMEQWSKNIMLQSKFPNFEDFVTTMTPPTSGAGAGGGEFKVLSSRPKQ